MSQMMRENNRIFAWFKRILMSNTDTERLLVGGDWNITLQLIANCKIISNWARKTVRLLKIMQTWKNWHGKVPEDVSWSHFFRIRENVSQSFRTKFLSLLYMISLAWKTSPCLCANHNPELRSVNCTGVTLFAPVLPLNCTVLSQSESREFFMCIIM